MRRIAMLMTAVVAAIAGAGHSDACTRVIYEGTDNLIVIGRSLDWKTPIPTNVYVYPRGMAKVGSDKPGAVTWTSRYGAVYAVGYDAGVTEGMNEMGLSVNGLFCKGTVYTTGPDDKRPPISLAMFPAWLLDMCATTPEVETMLRTQPFAIYGASFDEGTSATLHWGVTDREGRSIVIEFDHGVMNIYPAGDMQCMTNDPTWPSMQAIVKYWENIGGQKALPGTVSSPDRCVRGNYFVKHVAQVSDADLGASICRTVLFNCCVPYAYTTSPDGEPNVSMTQWRSLSNLRDLRYYFDIATAQGLWYVDLNTLDLLPGSPVLKIDTSKMSTAVGNQNHALKRVPPFTPMY